ncbi:sugar ABC transporter ATP-binding protein [Alphaproteobacteria bacterium]|nr:sugar ABC transporter ATP-binding protein [Alphaproteobacteria bacterium]
MNKESFENKPNDSFFNIVLKDICKSFAGTKALQDINIEFNSGEIHGLVGQNGAGKSTLGKIIGGTHSISSGKLIINDKVIQKWNPKFALDSGIAMIHQELALVPEMNVFDNIFLGIEKNKFGVLKNKNFNLFNDLEKDIGFGLNPKDKVSSLRIADQQKVEIMRALARDAKVIIMDEPTSSLTNDEVERLHQLILKLQKKNYLIIYVSHFLESILLVCNKVTVLRDGKLIRTSNVKNENKTSLVEAMLGKSVEIAYPKRKKKNINPLRTVVDINNLKTKNVIKNISLNIKEGEVVGLLGLVGSGRTETLRAIFGADRIEGGSIKYFGEKINFKNVKQSIKKGIVMIPEDRRKLGLVFTQNTKSNITITNLEKINNFGLLNKSREIDLVKNLIKEIDIKPNNPEGNISFYSGGNQQKVLFGKWIFNSPKLILLDEPTRGVDIGAKRKIYELINKLAESGVAVLLVSSELEEVMGLADRAYLIKNGITYDEIIPQKTILDDVLFSLFEAKKKIG